MAKNRKIPFGYMMQNGEIITNPKEVLAVATIFSSYLSGDSLTEIAQAMEVPYNEGVIWNKHMVKRIIENEKYLGTDKYPQLIDEDTFHIANAKRVAKSTSLCVISDELQQVRKLTFCKECGQRMFRKGGNTRSEKCIYLERVESFVKLADYYCNRRGMRHVLGKRFVYCGIYATAKLCRRISRKNAYTLLSLFHSHDNRSSFGNKTLPA